MALFKIETPPQLSVPLPCFTFLCSTFHCLTYYLFYLIHLATLSPRWYVPSGGQTFLDFFSLLLYPRHRERG